MGGDVSAVAAQFLTHIFQRTLIPQAVEGAEDIEDWGLRAYYKLFDAIRLSGMASRAEPWKSNTGRSLKELVYRLLSFACLV